MKWSIGSKIGGGFILALLALLLIGIVSYRSTNVLISSSQSVAHLHDVQDHLRLVLATLRDAESGQRGYVITGEDPYLEPYTTAKIQMGQVLQQLETLVGDDSDQLTKVKAIDTLVESKFDEMQSTIDARRDPIKGFDDARQIVLTDKGRQLTVDIYARVGALEDANNALLKQRADESQSNADETREVIILVTVIAFIVLALVGFAITQNISGPLTRISDVAQRITRGDLSATVSANGRYDEVGVLETSFSRMSTALQEMTGVAKKIAANDLRVQIKPQSPQDELGTAFATMVSNLRRSTTDLAEGVNVLASSASEILASTTQVAAGAAETGTAITQTTSTIEEVKQTAQVSSQKAKFVADNAQKAAQVSVTGRKAVESTIEGMRKIQGQMDTIAESVVKLSEQSQSIGEIIATVNDLAEQSNLLAVNASIEAAKAGDQGKGFSVVAQEIKSLAEQSKQATAQVRSILGEIQKATTAAVLATEQGSKSVDAGVKQAAESGESIRTLSDTMVEAAQAATQIAASSQQQLVGTDQVAMAMESIKQASVQNVAGTKQTETAAQNLHELGQKLKVLVTQYKI